MREIKRIFIHCTAGSQKQTLAQLLKEFKNKGWKSPGYHYVVFPDGKVEKLLDESLVSNGVQGYNSTSINIAYVGGIDNKGRAIDNRTDLQKAALLGLLEGLKLRYPNAHIMGHRDIWGKNPSKWKKQCPCFDAEAEYAHLDEAPVGKYDDAIEEFNNEQEEEQVSDYSPEYILDKPRDYTGFLHPFRMPDADASSIKTLRPW